MSPTNHAAQSRPARILRLYHGSPVEVGQPVFGKGVPFNDYGLGFYCTESYDLAAEWACSGENSGYVNAYDLELAGLSVVHLNQDGFTTLNWLALLLANRGARLETAVAQLGARYLLDHFTPAMGTPDVIVGYRADDSYFSFVRAFVHNEISLAQLERAMRLGKLGEQVVLKSARAFETVQFENAEQVDGTIYGKRRYERDEKARADFSADRARADIDGVFMRDILREEMEPDDPRLR